MYKSLLASAAITLVMTGAARADLPIAVAGPMTGDYAVFGAQMQRGAEQAVEDINAAGGVLGEQLVLSVGDDACDARQAVSVANQFASDGIIFVAGHYCSGSSIPASQVYAEEQIIQISPASTNPAFTEDRPGPGVFRVCGRDDQQGQVAGAYLAENFADANIAIIHDRTAYGMGLAEQTKKYMNEAGKEETMFEAFTPGEQDYTALVTRMKNEGIDVVYVGGYHTEAGLIRRQMSQAGMTDAVLISGDALLSEEYWAITGETGEGTLMTFAPDPRKLPEAEELVERFRAEGFEPEGYTLYTYATIQIWAQAVEAAGSTEFDAVVQALNEGTFDTVLGELEFNETGDTLLGYVFYEWSNGEYEQITSLEGGATEPAANPDASTGAMSEEEGAAQEEGAAEEGAAEEEGTAAE